MKHPYTQYGFGNFVIFTGQNLSGQGAKTFFEKKGAQSFFRKILGGQRLFLEKNRGAKTYFTTKI